MTQRMSELALNVSKTKSHLFIIVALMFRYKTGCYLAQFSDLTPTGLWLLVEILGF